MSRVRASSPARTGPPRLTAGELQLLQAAADGIPTRDLAVAVGLSEPAIKGRWQVLLARMGARNRAHAVMIALRWGVIQ